MRASTACSRLQLCNSLNSASATKPSLFCSVLHSFALFCTVLHSFALFCAVLCCFALFCTALHCFWCFVLFALYSAVCTVCIVLNCVAKCSAQFCNVFPPLNLHCSAPPTSSGHLAQRSYCLKFRGINLKEGVILEFVKQKFWSYSIFWEVEQMMMI